MLSDVFTARGEWRGAARRGAASGESPLAARCAIAALLGWMTCVTPAKAIEMSDTC